MIFFCDLDGTLIDSSCRHVVLLRRLLEERGYSFTDEQLGMYVPFKSDGRNTYHFLTDFLKIDEKCAENICAEWVEHIEDDELLNLDVLFNDTLDFLNHLKKQSNKIIYVTARKNKDGIRKYIERVGLSDYSDILLITDSNNPVDGKIKLVSNFIEKDSTFVGDTEVDYKCAKELGAAFYILNRGFRSKKYWDDKGIISYDSLDSIKAFID